jgi:hypothetical protein
MDHMSKSPHLRGPCTLHGGNLPAAGLAFDDAEVSARQPDNEIRVTRLQGGPLAGPGVSDFPDGPLFGAMGEDLRLQTS